MDTNKIVIFGPDNYNTLGMLRSLANRGFDILLLLKGMRQGVASASKYCTNCIFIPSEEDAVNYLINHFPECDILGKKAILMPGGDTYSLACAKNHTALSKRFHLMCTSDPEVLIRVTDKNEMGKEAARAGLLVPLSQKYQVDCKEISVSFPVILKHVAVKGRTEFKTKIIKSPKELDKFKKILNPDNTYIMQQFIPRSHDIYVYGCRLPNGEVKLAGYNTQVRWTDDGGGSFGRLYPEIPEYLQREALESLLESVDYHGLFSAEYGYYDGKAYFYEVNFRNDGFTHLSYQAGANLPLLWVQSCLNMPITASPVMTKSLYSINEVYDIANVMHRNISYRQYKRDLEKAQVFLYYDPEDPQPYENLMKRRIWEIPFRAVLKSFRPQIVWLLNKIGK